MDNNNKKMIVTQLIENIKRSFTKAGQICYFFQSDLRKPEP
jgi:regulatory protein YycI of two-component signal transduction system YycFG